MAMAMSSAGILLMSMRIPPVHAFVSFLGRVVAMAVSFDRADNAALSF